MFWFLLSFSVSDPEFCKSQSTEEEEKEGEAPSCFLTWIFLL